MKNLDTPPQERELYKTSIGYALMHCPSGTELGNEYMVRSFLKAKMHTL